MREDCVLEVSCELHCIISKDGRGVLDRHVAAWCADNLKLPYEAWWADVPAEYEGWVASMRFVTFGCFEDLLLFQMRWL